jgi:hypothetical protein
MSNDIKTDIMGFAERLQDMIRKHHAQYFPNLKVPNVGIDFGRKYAKIFVRDGDSGGRRVHCFVSMGDGAIYKAASWAAPAKHVRGNIYSCSGGLDAVTVYGAHYL